MTLQCECNRQIPCFGRASDGLIVMAEPKLHLVTETAVESLKERKRRCVRNEQPITRGTTNLNPKGR